MTTITQDIADARHIKRDDYVSCTVAFIDCKKPGSDTKENYSIIGPWRHVLGRSGHQPA